MTSDLLVLDSPLAKFQCATCGLVVASPRHEHEQHFTTAYTLYAHEHGRSEELARQRSYAQWLAGVVLPPASLYEAGSGNGSLLAQLRQQWPDATLRGVEPSPEASAYARSSGVDVDAGFLEQGNGVFELALAVNVIEHTRDPVDFLKRLASHARREVAIVCPDGDRANAELLIADHLYSFTRRNLEALMHKAGLAVTRFVDAPTEIGPFYLTLARPNGARSGERIALGPTTCEPRKYLSSWSSLESVLVARLRGRETIAFGTGEAAALLRTYAPRAWENVVACTVDTPNSETFADLDVLPYAKLKAPAAILVAARPGSQTRIAARLSGDGHTPIVWNDLISA